MNEGKTNAETFDVAPNFTFLLKNMMDMDDFSGFKYDVNAFYTTAAVNPPFALKCFYMALACESLSFSIMDKQSNLAAIQKSECIEFDLTPGIAILMPSYD